MNINSSLLIQVSNTLASYQSYQCFNKQSLQYRHSCIQNQLCSLSSYFSQSASSIERNETQLLNFKKGQVSTSHYENWNLIAQLMKKSKKTTLSRSITYTYAKASKSYSASYFSSGANVSLGSVKASGTCSATLWKNKKFDPKVSATAKVEASLVSSNAHMKLGTSKVYGYASATGYAGYLYAKAKAVFCPTEQTLEVGVGAAALRGSVNLSFHAFGASVTLTTSGSIGSAEASISYSHKNREWEFGSKLGFICGLGFKVKVNY